MKKSVVPKHQRSGWDGGRGGGGGGGAGVNKLARSQLEYSERERGCKRSVD